MSKASHNYYFKDPERWKAYRKQWVADNPEKVKDYHYRKQYGITYAEKQARIAAQDFRCAACGTEDPRGRGEWHTDHDHETKQLRGELCGPCNHALGLLGDSLERIQSLYDYLLKYKIGPVETLGSKSSQDEDSNAVVDKVA